MDPARAPARLVVLLTVLVSGMAVTIVSANEIFFSEYVEGSEGLGVWNKALEIYNPTAAVVNAWVEEIRIDIHHDGSPTPTGAISYGNGSNFLLNPGDTFVLVQITADSTFINRADDTVLLLSDVDGNDALVLRRGGVIVDVIGQIGFDPGPAGWGSGETTTANHTLRRKPFACDGDVDGSDLFNPESEWDGFPIDTFDGLGSHINDCQPNPTQATTWGGVKALHR